MKNNSLLLLAVIIISIGAIAIVIGVRNRGKQFVDEVTKK